MLSFRHAYHPGLVFPGVGILLISVVSTRGHHQAGSGKAHQSASDKRYKTCNQHLISSVLPARTESFTGRALFKLIIVSIFQFFIRSRPLDQNQQMLTNA